MVKLAPAALGPQVARPRRARGPAVARELPDAVVAPFELLRNAVGLTSVEPLFAEPPAMRRARAVAPAVEAVRFGIAASVAGVESELAGLSVATVAASHVSKDVIRTIESSPAVEYVEPLPVRWLLAGADPMVNVQWGLRAIRWFDAQLPPQPQVTIGVLDTGVDRNHPDLRGAVSAYETARLKTTDIVGHGTHVAGIIGATVNNAIGIAGVAPCRLAVWKVFGDEPHPDDGEFYVDSERYYGALRAAGDAGLSALNLSLGGTERFRTEELLIDRLVRRGVTVCAAMGNEYEDGDPTEYPAAFGGVVSVGAVAEDRRRSSFSNTGKHIDLVAPGSHILSTVPTRASAYRPETGYVAWNGTSMATPHVTAAAGLLAGANPAWGSAEVIERLRSTAAKLPAMRGRAWTREYGAGLLDLAAALS